MTIAEDIQRHLRRLPDNLQREALNYVKYLLYKAEQVSPNDEDDQEWYALSLAAATQGIEDDEEVVYTQKDLKVIFE